jgi:zinc transporter
MQRKQSMGTARPIPVFLNETVDADRGLICGYQLQAGSPPREIGAGGIVDAIAQRDVVTWLHFNLSDARARRWLMEASFLPTALHEVLQEHNSNRRIEAENGSVLLVVSDFSYEHESDPAEMAPLWCYAGASLLITARLHPLKSADELRLCMRGEATAVSGIDLATQLLELRTLRIKRLAGQMTVQLDEIEDEILAGSIKAQREHLGRARRLCARLRREFAPEHADLKRFLHRLDASSLMESDRDLMSTCSDDLGFAIEEIAELYERAKLLQEELASRLAENTGRNLYVLSILTAVLLPMTLVTGIFGMNVAGLPGVSSQTSFWWVMVLILVSGAATLAILVWRKLL